MAEISRQSSTFRELSAQLTPEQQCEYELVSAWQAPAGLNTLLLSSTCLGNAAGVPA